jgi:hypothetical protein
MAVNETYQQFVKQVSKGTSYSNTELLEQINNLNKDSEDYHELLTRLLVLLATKKPILVPQVKLSNRTAWMQYMKSNAIDTKASAMANTIKMLDKSPINQWVINLYEENWANTRLLVNYVNGLQSRDKVPYLHILLKTLFKSMFDRKLETEQDLKDLMARTDLIDNVVATSITLGGLKKISGETATNTGIYTWLTTSGDFNVLTDVIANANAAYDLGGGYCTPALSMQFKKKLISLDLIDPKTARTDNVVIAVDPSLEMGTIQYLDLLDQQKWEQFDVFVSSINNQFDSYFITSFGFATSTVVSIDNKTWIDTSYNAIKCITKLIAEGKDVYFILYGRPTARIHQNKVIGMRFVNKELVSTEIYQDPFSQDNKYVFGSSSTLSNSTSTDGTNLDYIR